MSAYDPGSAATSGRFTGRFFATISSANDPAWGSQHTFTDAVHGDFLSTGILIVNDSGNPVEISFDGVSVHGLIAGADPPLRFQNRIEAAIWIRSSAGGDSVRVFAW